MWRYLKAAFWARAEIAGLGRVPVNVIALAGVAILGFGHDAFWLLGAGLETAYLAGLASSDRFRRVVDAQNLHFENDAAEDEQKTLLNTLAAPRRERLVHLEERCARIVELYRSAQTDDMILDGNREALGKLARLYLKLLVAQQNLESIQAAIVEEQLKRQIQTIKKDLGYDKLTPSLRESKQATLRIFEQRLANLDRREQSLEEIDSDLVRIEAQIDLALENAGMRGGQPEVISGNIKLISSLLDDTVFSDSGGVMSSLDETFVSEKMPTKES